MFDFLFGWRKASKCKKLIKRVQCRLKLLKTKRHSIVRQLREDVAHLIKFGYQDLAYKRAEHLFNDETILAVYDLLENFCEFIIGNLSYIRRNKDCPNDINEAISSLIFASARCGDLPELRAVRKLFRERYGQRFEITALELMPGNLVNLQVKEKLSIKSVPDDVKQKLLDEIAKHYCLQPEILAIEYTPDPMMPCQVAGSCTTETANADDVEEKAVSADPESTTPSDSHQDDLISTNITSSAIEHCSSDVMESPIKSFEPVGAKECQITGRTHIIPTPMTASSSESLPQFPEEMIVYLDDIEEVKPCVAKEGSCQDQRIFKFKSSVLPHNTKGEDSYGVKYDSWSDSSNSSFSSRKRVKAARKRTKTRSLSRENSDVKDIHCVIYYDKPYQKPASNLHSKHHRKILAKNQPHSCRCFNLEAEDCCLKHPCYFCIGDGRADQEFLPSKPKDTTIWANESDTEIESFNLPTRKAARPPYLRAMTMPQERSKGRDTDNISRSSSFPVQSPSYVHPKLPDYDEIAAKFTALKREHQQNKHH